MKSVLFYLLLSFFKPAAAQEWPWFFSETAFKNWLVEKKVKCLRYMNVELPFSYVKSRRSYAYSGAIATYYFDEKGVLDYVRLEELAIGVRHDSLMTDDNYYFILD